MKLVGSNILRFKYLSCTTTGCRDIGIKKIRLCGRDSISFHDQDLDPHQNELGSKHLWILGWKI